VNPPNLGRKSPGVKFSRRGLLRASVGAGLGMLLPGCVSQPAFLGIPGPRPAEPERWALLSDPHISQNQGSSSRGVNMADHLRRAVAGVLGGDAPPAGVIVNGDCAYQSGQKADYRTFHDLISHPLETAGIPLHLGLGNHDDRSRFVRSLSRGGPAASPLEGRWVLLIPGRYANLIMLDSNDPGRSIGGRLGREQLNWLSTALAQNRDKPALVFGHHPMNPSPDLFGSLTGMADGPDLWRVLDQHEHVKAYVYGHTHRWNVSRPSHFHVVNLPATGYVFDGRQPSGWVDLWLGKDGARLDLHKLDQHGPTAGESAVIEWA
jgi:3',5'-cyclic-AMP phosphodiesterase